MINKLIVRHRLELLLARLIETKCVTYDGSTQWNHTDVERWLRDMDNNILPVQWSYILPIANQLWAQTEWKLK